jgi:DNA polymerase III epsilon subunit family exonuclease
MKTDRPLSDYIRSLEFVAFDTETTGIWAPAHRLVEIGAIRFGLESTQTERFSSLINPDRSMPKEVIAIHGITDDMVADAPSASTVLEQFREFCGSAVLVAHHSVFDISFVACELKRAGMTFGDNLILDTIDLHQRLSPRLRSYSLLSLVSHYGLAQSQEHRALADAEFVRQLVLKAKPLLAGIKNEQEMRENLTVLAMGSSSQEETALPSEFAALQEAIDTEGRVRIEYTSTGQPAGSRIIRPATAYRLGSRIYINAWCERSRAERTFRLDRIKAHELLSE